VSAGALAASTPISVVTATARREIVPLVRADREMVALQDLVADLGVRLTSDPRGGAATLAFGAHEVGLYHGKSLASVDGDLRLLSAPVILEAGRWLVPLDGVPRLLGPLLERPVEWRAAQRVLLLDDVRIPRISVSTFTTPDLARVVLEATESLPFRVHQEAGRVTVTIPRDLLDVSLEPVQLAGGIVESVRFLGGKENLFAVKLGPRFQSLKAMEQESPARLVLEFSAPPAAAPPPPRPAPVRRAQTAPRPEGPRTIVIDPGHGGDDVGARGPGGALEKEVTLAIARRLRAELTSALGVQVFLTRERDLEIDLDERTAIANNYKADLFISIHANASRVQGVSGSEVYFLSYRASDEEARRMAQIEGSLEDLEMAAPGSPLALILWDMAQAEHLQESEALASRIQEELMALTGSEKRGVKQAPFRVLVGATMPAVLVELGFISNPDEEKRLTSAPHQSRLVGALRRGIARYQAERLARLGLASPLPGGL
jgi:N-acetylmuramoyl-L-alanine amidase